MTLQFNRLWLLLQRYDGMFYHTTDPRQTSVPPSLFLPFSLLVLSVSALFLPGVVSPEVGRVHLARQKEKHGRMTPCCGICTALLSPWRELACLAPCLGRLYGCSPGDANEKMVGRCPWSGPCLSSFPFFDLSFRGNMILACIIAGRIVLKTPRRIQEHSMFRLTPTLYRTGYSAG